MVVVTEPPVERQVKPSSGESLTSTTREAHNEEVKPVFSDPAVRQVQLPSRERKTPLAPSVEIPSVSASAPVVVKPRLPRAVQDIGTVLVVQDSLLAETPSSVDASDRNVKSRVSAEEPINNGDAAVPMETVEKKISVKYIRVNYGTVTFPDGSVYLGDLLQRWEESHGVLSYPDGRSHAGMFKNKKLFQGEGTIRLNDGSVFEGSVKDGKWHGLGKLTYPDHKVLEGEFREGKIYQGLGTLQLNCGGHFEGTFVEGKKQGQGKLTYADGRALEGEFKNNKICNGQGTLMMADQKELTGEWKNFRFFSSKHLTFLSKKAGNEQEKTGLLIVFSLFLISI